MKKIRKKIKADKPSGKKYKARIRKRVAKPKKKGTKYAARKKRTA